MAFAALVALLGLVAFAVQRVWSKVRAHQHELSFARKNGCKPAPRLLNQRPWGIDRLEQIFRANDESRLMELFLFHFRLWGTTLEQVFLGTRAFGTIEPRNLEAILSSNFQDWSFGLRREVMFPLFGDGIFTQEGDAWKRSRELLRPQFVFRHMKIWTSSDNLWTISLHSYQIKGTLICNHYFFNSPWTRLPSFCLESP